MTKFKVFIRRDEILESYIPYNRHKLQYSEGVWVKARVGGLLVFEKIKDILDFLTSRDLGLNVLEIWEVEVLTPVSLSGNALLYLSSYDTDMMKRVWDIHDTAIMSVTSWPLGTEAYEQVKLIKRITK